MNLYLVRHAHALPANAPGIDSDYERPLSEQGQDQIVALADGLRRLGTRFDKLLTSPLVRARQTAEGLAGRLGIPLDQVELTEYLEPAASGKKLARLLRRLEGEHIALVGHEPDLSRLTAWLIGSKRARIDLVKAGVACVACDGPTRKGIGSLIWLVTSSWYSQSPGNGLIADRSQAPKPTGKAGKV